VSIDTPRRALDTSEISEKISQYWRVSVVEVTGSTQEDLKEFVKTSQARNGDVIAAEFQSAGRGRLGRSFNAPKSSALTFSLYFKPQLIKNEWSFLPLLTGLAAVFTIKEIDPQMNPTLKWPNDILLEDGKVGGIIAQASPEGIIVGVGINVEMSELELPVPHATSLSLHNCKELNRNKILSLFLTIFQDLTERWQQGEDLRHLYYEQSSTIGSDIRVELPDGTFLTGRATHISPAGELILQDGTHVSVGDIVHLR
jgi:BirA family transcriptional regulator, biotin operon repressor / biotin---[acetyl-CoA-carboxylase] ligase|tara:strand:- start:11296 stop:12063 length:768 start_codon:yes stop_codon:yes gene_type:complete